MLQTGDDFEDQDPWSIEDEKFDQVYPARIRKLSPLQWTPVRVAAEAAKLLVTAPGVRVLDIGCGPGKFCLIAAALTDGRFTGIEQRGDLAAAARTAAAPLRLAHVEIIHGNVTEIAFADYDAFYLYNPFEENRASAHTLDSAVSLSPVVFKRYTNYVAAQLGSRPLGTRVVTYAGYADEIPTCYRCESALFRHELKLWIKHHEYDTAIERLSLSPSRSYRGPRGWAAPRKCP
jgi:predicted RNA methylase